MSKSLRKILFILTLTLITSSVFCQTDKNGGSVYSIFGIGDLNYSASSRTDGMGIMGISLLGNYTNSVNPAAWTGISTTLFSTKFNYEAIKSTDGTLKSTRNYGNFDGFDFSIPANKNNGWIIDMGINQYSIVNYDIKFTGASGSDTYTQTYSGNGGISRINFGISYLLFKYISFGAQLNYMFGNISKTSIIDFDNQNIFDTHNFTTNSYSGFNFSTGLIFHGFGKMAKSKKLDDLAIGILFSTPFKFNSKITGEFKRSTGTDSLTLTEGKITMPWAAGFGISNTFNKKLTVAADAYYQKWEDYKFYDVHPAELKNSLRLGMGFEFLPSSKTDASIFTRMTYRLGGSYTMSYLKINGENINSYSVNAGFNIPLSRFNSLDLFVRYTSRGKTGNGLVKDDLLRVGASFNIGELWFLKSKEE